MAKWLNERSGCKAHFAAKKRQDGRRWFKVAWRTRNLRDVVAQSLSKAIHHRRHQKVPEDTIHAGLNLMNVPG